MNQFTAAQLNDMTTRKVKLSLLLDNSTSMDKNILVEDKMVPFKTVFVKAVNKFFQSLIDIGCIFEYDIVSFNTSTKYLHRNKSSKEFIPIDGEYETGGCTAFYDSVGEVIKNQIKLDKEKENIIINILLVITDGEDNSSSRMSCDSLKTLIDDVEKNNNYKVILFGTEIDTHSLGNKIGLSHQTTVNFEKTEEGINNIMAEASYSVSRCITGETNIKNLKIDTIPNCK